MAEKNDRPLISDISRINRLHRSIVEKRFKELDIHKSQYMILNYISKSNQELSQKDIADYFNVTPAAIAISIKKLQNMGLIVRSMAEYDNRINIVKITDKSKEMLKECEKMFLSIHDAMYADVTDEEKQTVLTVLKKMTDNLLELGAEEKPKIVKLPKDEN